MHSVVRERNTVNITFSLVAQATRRASPVEALSKAKERRRAVAQLARARALGA